VGAVPELRPLHHLGDQADAERGVRRHSLVVPAERDPERLGQADSPHEADRLDRGDQTERDVRIEERRVVGTDDDVGLVQEVEGACGADALHRTDDRLPHLLPLRAEQLARVLVVPHVERLAVVLADIEAGAERAVTCGAQHNGVHAAVVLIRCHASRTSLHIVRLSALRTVRAVQRDGRDR
jgi:hypothetical protein